MRIPKLFSIGTHGINKVGRFLTRSHHRKQQQKRQPDLSLRYAGNWAFVDPKTKHKHVMTIEPDLRIKIDHRILPGRIIGLDEEQLVFLDHYGFQLKVYANAHGPFEIYDESSELTYAITNLRDAPRQRDQDHDPDAPLFDYQVRTEQKDHTDKSAHD